MSTTYTRPAQVTLALKRALRAAGVEARKVTTSQSPDAWSSFIFTEDVLAAAEAVGNVPGVLRVTSHAATGFVGVASRLPNS